MNKKRVFIIHGWDGSPEEGCFPWLKSTLEKKGFVVENPSMPDPLEPKVEVWVNVLKEKVGMPDEQTYFVGHSMGAQTVLRYLESLDKKAKIGGSVFIAGWIKLTPAAYEDEEDKEIAKPWLETPIDWRKVKSHTNNFVAIFSDNDSIVPVEDSQTFRTELGAKIIIEHGKGHFSGSDGIKKLDSALSSILEMSKKSLEH